MVLLNKNSQPPNKRKDILHYIHYFHFYCNKNPKKKTNKITILLIGLLKIRFALRLEIVNERRHKHPNKHTIPRRIIICHLLFPLNFTFRYLLCINGINFPFLIC